MAYIGNQTSTAFTSMAKQDITGDGGASYTLTHAVANEQEIEVYVNNVRQEPGVAYTVSGTALTMTGNVASTDDFYVVYQGKAVATTNHPSTQPLSATTGTFGGDVGVTGTITATSGGTQLRAQTTSQYTGVALYDSSGTRDGLIDYDHTNNRMRVAAHKAGSELAFTAGGYTEHLKIDGSGRISTPNSLAVASYLNTSHNHPGSGANKVTNWSQSTGTGNTFPAAKHHSSFDYTNSRFVAPVAGLYLVSFKPDYDRTLTNNHYVSFGINGSNRSFDVLEDLPQYNNSSANYPAYLYLNQNDYVEMYTHGGVTYELRGGGGNQWQTWWFIIQLA